MPPERMIDSKVHLLSSAWYGDTPHTVTFPGGWKITHVMQNSMPALTAAEIKDAIAHPVGTPSLSELVKGKHRIAIIVDDIQRPTPIEKIIVPVIDALKEGGADLNCIIVVMATGAHRPATHEDFIKKIGKRAAENLRLLPHDCRSNLTHIGKTSRGTPLLVNRDVMKCDLKIVISGVYPHDSAGFGGGPKVVNPGICGVETIRHLHSHYKGVERGGSTDNDLRADMEEAAEMVGLDFAINVIVNPSREACHLTAGHRVLAHREAVIAAHSYYGVKPVYDADLVVVNAYPFDLSLQFVSKGLWPFKHAKKSASRVVIASCPEGSGYHALSPTSLPWHSIERLRMLSRYDLFRYLSRLKNSEPDFFLFSLDITQRALKSIYPKAHLFRRWEKLIAVLRSRHEGQHVNVAVYPTPSLQFAQTPAHI